MELRPQPIQVRGESAGLPIAAGQAGLDRPILPGVEAEIEIQAVALVPVALPQGIGEAAPDPPAGEDTDQVQAGRRSGDVGGQLGAGGQFPGVHRFAVAGLAVEVQVGVDRQRRAKAAQALQQAFAGVPVGVRIQAQVQPGAGLAAIAYQAQR